MIPYYDRNGITIYCGDCLEIMPHPSPPFDAIISDWPYGTTACNFDKRVKRSAVNLVLKALDALKIDPQLVGIFKRIAKEMYSLPLNPLDVWPHYKRLVKDNGAVVLFGSQPFTTMLINSNLEWFRYEMIWQKDQSTGGLNANRMPLRNHEDILVFYRNPPTYNPQKFNYQSARFKIGEKTSVTRCERVIGETPYGKIKERFDWIEDGRRYPLSVVFCSSAVRGADGGRMVKASHPTQKPLPLLQYLIRTYTDPGDLILDNAMGSGTTLLAAQNEGRRAVGIELSEEYCAIAVDRLRQPSFFSLPTQPNGTAKQLQLIEV